MSDLLTWQECTELDITSVHDLYRKYVSASQVDLIGSFGFGRVTATRAEGMYIHTDDGRQILDFTGGIGVLSHGHNHPRILAARTEFQKQGRMEVYKNFLSPYVAGLSRNIASLLPEDLNISYFCNSGAEAVEGSVKLAYKYHDGDRQHILHSDISFHGKLLGAASLTGSPELHFQFPQIPNTEAFVYNDLNSVESLVSGLRRPDGKSDVYAIILEPFSASSLRECSTEFLAGVRALCDREDIVLIFDEVYTGWAKTGELFYFQHHGVVPDVLTTSKSFGGGKASVACYTTRERFFRKAFDNLTDATLHSTTFNGFGEECATAIEALNIIVDDDYVGRSKRIHTRLSAGLQVIRDKHPGFVKDVRGRGSLNGVLLDAKLAGPLDRLLKILPVDLLRDEQFLVKLVTGAVIAELYTRHGILTFFGSNREVLLIISPSLIVTDEEIDRFLTALDETLSVGKMRLVLRFAKDKFTSRVPAAKGAG